jgi:hypothetical protein
MDINPAAETPLPIQSPPEDPHQTFRANDTSTPLVHSQAALNDNTAGSKASFRIILLHSTLATTIPASPAVQSSCGLLRFNGKRNKTFTRWSTDI